MKVGIVGAGIAGLATAAGLTRQGAEVVVYERPDARPAGAGISLFGNGLRALDALGLSEPLAALGAPPDVPAGLRTPDGSWLVRAASAASTELTVVSRVALHDILAASAPDVRFTAVSQVRGSARDATVVLESGETTTFDLVVGADGIASDIRRSWPHDPGIRYAGYTAWRGLTSGPVDVLAAGETWGRGERFGIVPMGDGRVYWFATASVPAFWSVPDEKAELLRRFATWHDPIPELLHATDARGIVRNDITDLAAPLRRFVVDRVVLAGDAAHAMTPNFGQGGNQALEDAVTLAALIAGHDDLDFALDRYDVLRRSRTAPMARRSWQLGRVAQARHPAVATVRDALLRLMPASATLRAGARLQAWEPPSQGGDAS